MRVNHVQHQLVLIDDARHAQQHVPAALGPQHGDDAERVGLQHAVQCPEIALHPAAHEVGLDLRRLQQVRDAGGDDVAHRQVVVGDDIQPTHGLANVRLRARHLNPADLGMGRGEHLREPIQRERQRPRLAGEPCIAGERLQCVIVEHLVGDDGDTALAAQADELLALPRLDVGPGRIVGVDEHQSAYTRPLRPVQQRAQLGDVDVP